MKKFTVIIALAIGCLMLGSTVWADDYLTGQVGLFNPEDDSVLDNGYNLEIAYGKSLVDIFPGLGSRHSAWKNVTAELGIGYRHADGGLIVSNFIATTTTSVDLDVIPITLMAIYNFDIPKAPIKFYAGAGPGIYYAKTDTRVTTIIPGVGTTTVSDDDTDVKFGVLLKGGVLFSLNERLDLSGGLQTDLVSDDVGGVCVNIGVRYYF